MTARRSRTQSPRAVVLRDRRRSPSSAAHPRSPLHGKHMRNGWKNAGLPWGYDFHPDLMWVDHHADA